MGYAMLLGLASNLSNLSAFNSKNTKNDPCDVRRHMIFDRPGDGRSSERFFEQVIFTGHKRSPSLNYEVKKSGNTGGSLTIDTFPSFQDG